ASAPDARPYRARKGLFLRRPPQHPEGGLMNQSPANLLEIRDLKKTFSIATGLFSRKLTLTALSDINFNVRQGETLGIVGESGCGKSTLGRCILQLISPDEGQVLWLGQD